MAGKCEAAGEAPQDVMSRSVTGSGAPGCGSHLRDTAEYQAARAAVTENSAATLPSERGRRDTPIQTDKLPKGLGASHVEEAPAPDRWGEFPS